VAIMLRAETQVRFHVWHSIFGAFAKLRKASISFGISVRPSVRVEKLGSNLTDFRKILYLNIFRKTFEKIQFN
jgi:hypothetical protein